MKLIIVEWVDVSKKISDDAFDENKDIDSLLAPSITIGWLYKETARTVFLVQEFSEGKVHDWVAIPRVLITKTEVICDK